VKEVGTNIGYLQHGGSGMKTGFGKIGAEEYWQKRYAAEKTGRYQVSQGGAQKFEDAFAQTRYQQSSSAAGRVFLQEKFWQVCNSVDYKRASILKAYEEGALENDADLGEKDNGKATEKQVEDPGEARTETDIIIKPDGSRVLVITMNVGQMETTMSLKISEPTDTPNDSVLKEDDLKDLHSDAETMWREGMGAGETEG